MSARLHVFGDRDRVVGPLAAGAPAAQLFVPFRRRVWPDCLVMRQPEAQSHSIQDV